MAMFVYIHSMMLRVVPSADKNPSSIRPIHRYGRTCTKATFSRQLQYNFHPLSPVNHPTRSLLYQLRGIPLPTLQTLLRLCRRIHPTLGSRRQRLLRPPPR